MLRARIWSPKSAGRKCEIAENSAGDLRGHFAEFVKRLTLLRMRIAEFDSTITVRLAPERRLALELVAERQGITLSELIRQMIDVVIAAAAEERERG